MKRCDWGFRAGAFGAVMLAATAASAQPPAAPATNDAPASQSPAKADDGSEAKREEARQRYQCGLQIYTEGNFEAARVEFERAYQLAPSYKILYNIGLCYEQLGDYVQALTTLKRYLDLGGAEIDAERRAVVDKELAQVRPRIARAIIILNTPGSEILVDDACATDRDTSNVNCGITSGNTRQILMNPGRRRITARKSGYFPETQVVTVAGSDDVEVKLDLKAIPKVVETNPWKLPTYIGLGLTVAGTATAIVTGVMANGAKNDQAAATERLGATRQELDDAKSKTKTLANVTDGIWIGTGVVALASAYVTFRALRWKGSEGTDVNVQVGMDRVNLTGHF
jgi:tetratricopeptide (TPR) repeat protein